MKNPHINIHGKSHQRKVRKSFVSLNYSSYYNPLYIYIIRRDEKQSNNTMKLNRSKFQSKGKSRRKICSRRKTTGYTTCVQNDYLFSIKIRVTSVDTRKNENETLTVQTVVFAQTTSLDGVAMILIYWFDVHTDRLLQTVSDIVEQFVC